MVQKDNDIEIKQKLLEILDGLINEGRWDEALFLQASSKKIVELRDKVKQSIEDDLAERKKLSEFEKAMHDLKRRADLAGVSLDIGSTLSGPDLAEIYITLYQADGEKINNWENALDFLLKTCTTRPIYTDETAVKEALAKNGNKANDAYIAVKIFKNEILPPAEKPLQDKHGYNLIAIKERAISRDNIERFVHLGSTYKLAGKNLIKQNN